MGNKYTRLTYDDFGRTVMHPPLNIERKEEKDSGSLKIRFKRHFVTELHVIKRIGDNFRAKAIDV